MLFEPGFSVSERVYEYAFMIRELRGGAGRGLKVLDFGNAYEQNFLVSAIPEMGFRYYGADRRPFPFRYKNFRQFECDVKKGLPFGDGFFDYALGVSSIEHVGLEGMYGESGDDDGDSKAMHELARVTRKGGCVLVTLPFNGKKVKIFRPSMRAYDMKAIKKLFGAAGLKIEKAEIRVLCKGIYEPVSIKIAGKFDFPYAGKATMLAFIRARKT